MRKEGDYLYRIKSRIVYALICYLLAVLILFIGIPVVLSKTYGKTETVKIRNPVAKGEQITDTNIEVIEVGNLNLPEDLLKSQEDVIGRYAVVDIVAGDWLLASKISPLPLDGNSLPEELPAGAVAVSVSIHMIEGSTVSQLKMGDIIKLYHYTDHLEDIPELQFVKVLSVLPNEKQEQTTITVLALEKQAVKLTDLKKKGKLFAALISRDNDPLAADLLKQQQDYLYPDGIKNDNQNN